MSNISNPYFYQSKQLQEHQNDHLSLQPDPPFYHFYSSNENEHGYHHFEPNPNNHHCHSLHHQPPLPIPIAIPPSSFGSPSSERDFNSPFIQSIHSASSPHSYQYESESYTFLSPHQQPERDFQLFSPTMSPIIQSIEYEYDQQENQEEEVGLDDEWLRNAPLFPDVSREGNEYQQGDDSASYSPSSSPNITSSQPPSSNSIQSNQDRSYQIVSPFQIDLNSFQDDSMTSFNPYQSSSLLGGEAQSHHHHLNSSPSPAISHRGSLSSSTSTISIDHETSSIGMNSVGKMEGNENENANLNGKGKEKAVLDQVSQLARQHIGEVDKLLEALNEKGIVLEEGMISEILAVEAQRDSMPDGVGADTTGAGLVEERDAPRSSSGPNQPRQSTPCSSKSSVNRFEQGQENLNNDAYSSPPSSPDSVDLISEQGSPDPPTALQRSTSTHHDEAPYMPPGTSKASSRKRRSSTNPNPSSSSTTKRSSTKPSKYKQKSRPRPPDIGPTGSIPTCIHCGTTFTRQFNLKTHMETHIPAEQREKPFVCSKKDCEKSFSRKSDMKRHMKIHARI